MLKIQALLHLTFIFLFFSGAHPATISIINKCLYKIWPASLTAGNGLRLATTGFELTSGASTSVVTPVPWNGRFWARTNCNTVSAGKFTCRGDEWGQGPSWNEVLAPSLFTCDSPGDCASGQVSCNENGGNPPATLVEFNIAGGGGQDFYDISLVVGFNLPVSVTPKGGNGDCRSSSCAANVNANCPSELQVKKGDGSVVGCNSACTAREMVYHFSHLPSLKKWFKPERMHGCNSAKNPSIAALHLMRHQRNVLLQTTLRCSVNNALRLTAILMMTWQAHSHAPVHPTTLLLSAHRLYA